MAAKRREKLDKDFDVNNPFGDLSDFRLELKKEFGSNSALSDDDFITGFIPTGVTSLDYLLGGGIPQGKLTEFCGLEGAGKSSFGIHMLGQIQKEGGLGVLIDTEAGAGDRFRFDMFNVDTDKCIVTVEDLAEKAFAQVEKVCNYISKKNIKVPSLCIIDSIAGLTTAAEMEADMSEQQYAVTARMIKRGVQRVKLMCRETNLALLCVNQVRVKIGGMTNRFSGPEYVSPGGSTLSFQYISRLFLTKGAFLGEAKLPEGHKINMKIIKCKTSAALGRTLPVRFYYDSRGFDNIGTTYDLLNTNKLLGNDGAGAWKTVTLPSGEERKFNQEKVFYDLYNASPENKAHFDKMMKDCYNNVLNLSSATQVEEEQLPIIEDAD